LVVLLVAVVGVGGTAWRFERELEQFAFWFTHVRGQVLTAEKALALAGDKNFQDCADCPTMVVVPAGIFQMGSPLGQGDRSGREYNQHSVTIAAPLAVSKFELTFAEWDVCAAYGPCAPEIAAKWGRGRQPVINVTWEDAQAYAAWLSSVTGQPYRLLTEAEYEYAARAGAQTAYPWGPSIGVGNAQCGECGPSTGADGVAAVGSFQLNKFGLGDMIGNVYEWVEDCFHANYNGAPSDGSAWSSAGCPRRVVRGGSWLSKALEVRSAARDWTNVGDRRDDLGFRVARSLRP
jgi:formylglycine-generating enzyme required for sulfatase activity